MTVIKCSPPQSRVGFPRLFFFNLFLQNNKLTQFL